LTQAFLLTLSISKLGTHIEKIGFEQGRDLTLDPCRDIHIRVAK
jgi:hypothetical protein